MKKLFIFFLIFLLYNLTAPAQTIINHSSTDLANVPGEWISSAKNDLHIAYGHTSHGSQITDGMSGLVTFTGGIGGLQFDWNNGGYNGALDLSVEQIDIEFVLKTPVVKERPEGYKAPRLLY